MGWFRSAVPAVVFFALLGGAAAAGFFLGAARTVVDTRIFTCSMHPQVRQQGPGKCPQCHMELVPVESMGKDEGPGITIDPVVVQNMGVRLATAARGALRRTVFCTGELLVAENRQYDVTLKVGGYIVKLYADTEGMPVAAGDPLFELYSPQLLVAQQELLAALRSGDQTLLAAARQKLAAFDVPPATVAAIEQAAAPLPTLRWTSRTAGVLLKKNVVTGAAAMMNESLLRIADLSELWLDAQVPEHLLAAVAVGAEVTATFVALPGQTRSGRITFVAPAITAASRTATVRVALPNQDGRLKPGMSARLSLPVLVAADAVLVPSEAVLDTGTRQLVWLAVGTGKFEARAVQSGAQGDDGLTQILAGLDGGERVVVSGQLLIDAESRLREGTRKLHPDGLLPRGELPPAPAISVGAATQPALDRALAAYLEVGKGLAADAFDAASWQLLADAARALAAAPETALQPLANDLAQALASQPPADIVAARVQWKTVSTAAARLFERARPQAGAAPELFVLHCPMADADWLQLDRTVRNPYYGKSMLDCGQVRRTQPLAPRTGK
jgi:multidrug efflux pump subunit AcrA (membrane-fusion protein)